jgi:ribosome biogenesis GTPase
MQIIAANVDRVYLVVTLKSPETQVAFIDRFLVAAESFRIPTPILFNTIDLYGEDEHALMKYLTEVYEPLGYPCNSIIAESNTKSRLQHRRQLSTICLCRW